MRDQYAQLKSTLNCCLKIIKLKSSQVYLKLPLLWLATESIHPTRGPKLKLDHYKSSVIEVILVRPHKTRKRVEKKIDKMRCHC